jgi:hypothetical protein
VRQAGVCHDLLYRYIVESIAVKKLSRTVNDLLSHELAVAGRIGHSILLQKHAIWRQSMRRVTAAIQQNIILNIF